MVILDQGGLGRRDTELVAPPVELAALVEHAFIRRDRDGARPAGRWRVVPDPSAHLVIVVRGATVSGAVVGARSTYADIDVADRRLTIGVRLRPGALPAIVHAGAGELTDRAVAAGDVFGAAWRAVAERAGDGDPRAVVRGVFELLRRAARPRDVDPATIAAARTARSVVRLADTLDLPLRTLHKRSRDTIGLGPKRLLRILRVHRALDAYRRALGWARVAVGAGFADQPHLVRELRDLLGEPPGDWLARGRPAARDADSFKPAGGRAASVRR